jgi:hypothetical protein
MIKDGALRTGLMLALIAWCWPALARAEPAPETAPATAHSADFDSLVKALKGKWTTLIYEGQDEHAAQPMHGEQLWRMGLGGLVLMEEERISSPDGDQYVLALHWWDRSTNSLKGMLCNNSGSGACNVDSAYRSKLNWDGKRFTIDLVFPQGSNMMVWHEEFFDFTGSSYTQTGDMGKVGGPLKRVATIHAKKAAD